MIDLPLEALGALAGYVAITMFAPRLLTNPTLITRHPRPTIVAWLLALGISVALLWLGTGLIIAEAIQRAEHGVAGADWATSVAGSILTWLSFAFLGVIGFRLVVAVQTVTEERRAQIDEVSPMLRDAELVAHDGGRLFVVGSPELILAAVPFADSVVVSHGVLDRLTTEQFDAALEHERTHLRHRHSLLVSLGQFAILTAGGVTASRRFTQAIRIAIELVADDVAAKRFGTSTVADALSALYPDSSDVAERVARLHTRVRQ